MKVWTWVDQPEQQRPQATGPGRYSRPLAQRDLVIAAAFGKEVRRLRRLAKMSTRGLGLIVGMSQPAIVKLEKHDGANIELRLVWDFAQALDVTPDHFMEVVELAVQTAQRKTSRRRSLAGK